MSDNPDPAHGTQPFIDESNAYDFGRSTTSRFTGLHVYPDHVERVAKTPGGGGLTGDLQPETD